MAFVIAIAQRKGGAGKTTLACQLSAAFLGNGLSVVAIDTDEQASLSNWATARKARLDALHQEEAFAALQATGYSVASTIRRAERTADIVLIDTPPTTDRTVARALAGANLVLSPLQLSPLDLEASIPTARLISEANTPAKFVINRAPPRARIADLIRSQIKQHALPTAKTELGNRAVYQESLATGKGVLEVAGAAQAKAEINALTREILKIGKIRVTAHAKRVA